MPLTGITEAVYARALSGQRKLRAEAEKKLPHKPRRRASPIQRDIDSIRDALYASKIVAYAQGYEQMTAASKEYRLGLEARRSVDDLARRLHHPGPLPRPHPRSL